MSGCQQVSFPPKPAPVAPRRSLALPALFAATAVVFVVAGAGVLLLDHCLPALGGANLLDRADGRFRALGFSALLLLLWCAWLATWLACRLPLRGLTRTESRLFFTWALALSALFCVALPAVPLQVQWEEQAEARFVEAMAPALDTLRRAEAQGRTLDSIDERAAERCLRRALPRAPQLHVVYQTRHERLRWAIGPEVEIDHRQRVVKVLARGSTDTAATERWRGRSVDDLRRRFGTPESRDARFGAPWRLLVVRRDEALVYEAGQTPSEYGVGPWHPKDVCKAGLLDWDDDPQRFMLDE